MLYEYYYDEDGIRRKRKKSGSRELQDIDVSEISLVDYPSTRKSFLVCKSRREEGELMEIFDYLEDLFDEELSHQFKKSMEEKAEKMSAEALGALTEAVKLLWEYKEDYSVGIKSALKVLISFLPPTEKYPAPGKYPYPVKKRASWPSIEEALFSKVYLQKTDLEPSPGDKFPSISEAIRDKKAAIDAYYEDDEE